MESRDEVKKTEGEREERNGGTKDRWRKKERGSRTKALVEMPFRKEKKNAGIFRRLCFFVAFCNKNVRRIDCMQLIITVI